MKRIVILLAVMILALSLCVTVLAVDMNPLSNGNNTVTVIPGNWPGNWAPMNPSPGSSNAPYEEEYESEEEDCYIIHAVAKTGGKIVHADDDGHPINKIDSQSFDVEVVVMDDCSFDIVPKDGYRITKVSVDGTDMGAISHYEFEDVDRNHSIRAYFEKLTASNKPVNNKTDDEFNPNTGAL